MLQAGEDFDSAVVEQLFTFGSNACKAVRSKPYKMCSIEDLAGCIKLQPLQCTRQEEKMDKRRMRRSKSKGQPVAKWVSQHQGNAMKGFRLVLFFDPGGYQNTNGESCKWPVPS